MAIMAWKKSVNAENLAALGAERLASILMDLAEHDANTKRRFVFSSGTLLGSGSLGD